MLRSLLNRPPRGTRQHWLANSFPRGNRKVSSPDSGFGFGSSSPTLSWLPRLTPPSLVTTPSTRAALETAVPRGKPNHDLRLHNSESSRSSNGCVSLANPTTVSAKAGTPRDNLAVANSRSRGGDETSSAPLTAGLIGTCSSGSTTLCRRSAIVIDVYVVIDNPTLRLPDYSLEAGISCFPADLSGLLSAPGPSVLPSPLSTASGTNACSYYPSRYPSITVPATGPLLGHTSVTLPRQARSNADAYVTGSVCEAAGGARLSWQRPIVGTRSGVGFCHQESLVTTEPTTNTVLSCSGLMLTNGGKRSPLVDGEVRRDLPLPPIQVTTENKIRDKADQEGNAVGAQLKHSQSACKRGVTKVKCTIQ
ncbi:unnamed protein product [Protopolystoma xenopodis]|uniref:Uncharacterized protein n=1 Tax=Protopolystoma xenopodis TaxID=117903 RepID=A0A3S5CN00_9PLAT|nr:unnamed protein product [Protopolystoma xenopodis]